ncbi:MAG: M1 family metallopeptidase, partial [Flammeovirgaceae bacterium]|nr:M1 family metallopeptidase [Flammeovirgaceae bacterium]
MGGRGGYECFPDGNCLFTIAQWFPRMAVYSDAGGWIHKQFLGSGEFTLPFGKYLVKITVPEDHLVAATGTLKNPEAVLTDKQRELLKKAETATKPVIITTQQEAIEKELAYVSYKSGKSKKSLGKKTWIYEADSVRDFAWGSSRKFIWDAMGVPINGKTVMAMSYYPKEANPLWEKYSTEVVAHTLKVYSKYTIPYPYPKAISVEASNGMEYPMICFNYGRPEPDGTYSDRVKYGMISVIIHEVGHNFFPMVINSDERHWTWMDEGLNSFVQFLAEQEWERDYPSRRGPAHKIVDYMKGDKKNDNPIMTDSESVLQLGNNAYGKPATALNILRETIMGRELFDYAFKEYCRRWAFKHPTPADFFRTMEDASGTDLDWFWRGWFYTLDHVDIAIEDVILYQVDTQDPDIEKLRAKKEREKQPSYIYVQRNDKEIPQRAVDLKPDLKDFYNTYDPLDVTQTDRDKFAAYYNSLSEEEKKFLKSGKYFYQLTFTNKGGLVMPIILEMEFEDGTKELKRIPAEIWRYHNEKVTKVFATVKPVKQFTLDPYLETADVDTENNYFPPKVTTSRFQLYKQ